MKAIGELERKIVLAELEKKEAELSVLNKTWFKLQEEQCDAEDEIESETKVKEFEEQSELLDKAIETLEAEIKNLRWAKHY